MKKLTLLIALIVLGSCSPKKNSVTATATATTIAGVSNAQCVGTTSASSMIGAIYDTSATSYNFETQVKALLSATMSPYDVGSVSSIPSASTGVRFKGALKLDANGAVVPASTNVLISVYDSTWLTNKYTNQNEVEIQIQFNSSKANTVISGQFDLASGVGYLSFKDSYGEIRFTGRIDAQNFSGTVTFQNTVTVMGGTPSSGTLGQFLIPRCGIVQ